MELTARYTQSLQKTWPEGIQNDARGKSNVGHIPHGKDTGRLSSSMQMLQDIVVEDDGGPEGNRGHFI